MEDLTNRYDALKKYVYQLEKQQAGIRDSYHDLEAANETTSLMGTNDISSTDGQFLPLLDRELKKIDLFYEAQQRELVEDVAELQRLVDKQEESGPDGDHHFTDLDEDDEDEDEEEDDDFRLLSPTVSQPGTTRSYSAYGGRRQRSRSESAGAFTGVFVSLLKQEWRMLSVMFV